MLFVLWIFEILWLGGSYSKARWDIIAIVTFDECLFKEIIVKHYFINFGEINLLRLAAEPGFFRVYLLFFLYIFTFPSNSFKFWYYICFDKCFGRGLTLRSFYRNFRAFWFIVLASPRFFINIQYCFINFLIDIVTSCSEDLLLALSHLHKLFLVALNL